MEEKVVLFENKKDCCGCGACMNVCPKGAISMEVDDYGFEYPIINYDLCVGCKACQNVCCFKNSPTFNYPKYVYGLSAKNREEILNSASGGVFVTLAKSIIDDDGYVYGVSLETKTRIEPNHICVNAKEELSKLQGSKYVQSNVGRTYDDIKKKLITGKKVLFSGTPCQVAGLIKFLGKKYDNLLTIEIVCHGVPGRKMFQDFIQYYEKKVDGKIMNFRFRDKSRGQGYTTRADFSRNNKIRSFVKKGELFAYIFMFSKSLILRENCYTCPFSQEKRVADITIGDFWGFEKVYGNSVPNLDEKYGISCALCNTDKGTVFLQKNLDLFYYVESDFSSVAKYNKQLNGPSSKPVEREHVMEKYKSYGYEHLEKIYWKKYTKYKIKNIISNLTPTVLKRLVK